MAIARGGAGSCERLGYATTAADAEAALAALVEEKEGHVQKDADKKGDGDGRDYSPISNWLR